MWYPPKTVGDDPDPVIDRAVAKRQCGELPENTDFDEEIDRLIVAAQDHVERYCGQYLSARSVTVECDSFGDFAHVAVAPVLAVTAISYIDTDGAAQTLDASIYVAHCDMPDCVIEPKYGKHWPAIQPRSRVTVTADIGYKVVPPTIIQAMLLWISTAFINRENQPVEDVAAFDYLLVNHRRYA